MANILMLTHNHMPDVRIEKQARSLKEKGHKVFLITTELKGQDFVDLFEGIYTHPHTFKHNLLTRILVNDVTRFYEKIIKENQIEIIHAHNIFTAFIALSVVRKLKLKFIYDDHETWSLWLRNRAEKASGFKKVLRYYLYYRAKKLEKKIPRKADLLIVTNVKCLDFYNKLGIPSEKIITVENVALRSEIEQALKNTDLVVDFIKTDKRKKIIHTYHQLTFKDKAQASKDLHIDRIINRFVDAADELDDWVLVLFGPKNPELEKRGVVFIDYMPRVAYLANIANADVGINPLVPCERIFLTSQNRIYEYGLIGLRTISTRTPLIVEHFGDKVIWYDPDESYEKLLEILRNIDDYPSGAEFKKYCKKFSWQTEAKKMLDAYDRI
ncbi:MAG: glycosyltransferase, partial [Candidatus Heimdallarchaeota archaeon]